VACVAPSPCWSKGEDDIGEVSELKDILQQLGGRKEAIPFSQLYPLSDLTRDELDEFGTTWATLPTAQRRRLIHALVELAESSFQVNFDAIFRHCLADADEEVRASAIEGLWENEEIGLVGPLLSMVRADPSARVRAAAATGLGRFVLAGELEQLEAAIQARIVTELLTTIHLVDESVQVRRRALESAAYACTPAALEALEIAYFDDDDEMRISAVVGMGRSCDSRWADIVLTELGSTSAAMRYEAALASGELMLRRAVPLLEGLLNDADPLLRDTTIWALGQIGGYRAKQILLTALEDADEDTRSIVEEALAEQALSEGDLDFMLYEVGQEQDEDLFDDEISSLWSADDQEADELGEDDWEP
jgi:HEAT repeat protein